MLNTRLCLKGRKFLFHQGLVVQYTSTGGRFVIFILPTYRLVVSREAQVLVVVWVAFV